MIEGRVKLPTIAKLEELRRTSPDPYGVDVVAQYRGVERAMEESGTYAPLCLYGEDVDEVYNSYSTNAESRRSFNSRHFTLAGLTRSAFRGRLARFLPFRLFLENGFDAELSVSGDHFRRIDQASIAEIVDLNYEELFRVLADRYTSSRRPGSRNVDICDEAVSTILGADVTGPVFVGNSYPRLNISTIVSIWLWGHKGKYPLIVLNEGFEEPDFGMPNFERDYISIQQALPIVAEFVDRPESKIKASLPYWASGFHGDARKVVRAGLLTSTLVRRVITSAQNVDEEDLASAFVPDQIPALVEFEIQNAQIGIRKAPIADVPPERAAGASRALRALVRDVLEFGGLDNVIPNWRLKLGRLDTILERISTNAVTGVVEESDIIEFGVEISAFESRVHEARGKIGELTIGEVLALLIEARGFLGSFPQWVSYKASSRVLSPDDSIESAEVAIQILSNFAADDAVMSVDARERVGSISDYEVRDIEDETEASAMSSSARNLTAAAAKSLFSSNANRPIQGEISIRQELASRVARIMLNNSGNLVRFAAINGERWLDLAVQYAIEHGRTK